MELPASTVMHMCVIDVSLQCLQFACYVSGGRRRFCVAVTQVVVYNGCIRIGQRGQDGRSVKSTETFFPGLRSFFRTPKRFSAMRERRLTSHSDQIVSECPGVDVDR